MLHGIIRQVTWALPIILTLGCATKVSRVQSDSTMDISGKWNDTDSRLVAEEMINDCLSKPWLHKYQSEKTTPKVIVGKIANKSHEHISIETFVKDIERVLLNSGKVDFVASKTERKQLREEVSDQSEHASAETAKSSGEEVGADLMLIGTISTIVDQEGSKAVVFYQVDMELIEMESNMKKWIGNKKIKKYVKRTKTKF
ncbi:penicillin-binding protein activator LpoB [Fibrobacterota bacterium]